MGLFLAAVCLVSGFGVAYAGWSLTAERHRAWRRGPLWTDSRAPMQYLSGRLPLPVARAVFIGTGLVIMGFGVAVGAAGLA